MGTYTNENIEGVCRLCAKTHEHMKPIYFNQCVQHNLQLLIQKLLPFINNLNEKDILPNHICVDCTSILLDFNNLWETSRVINDKFKSLIIDNENKLVVNEEEKERLSDHENKLNVVMVENSIYYTPMKPLVLITNTNIEDQNTHRTSTIINDFEESAIDEPTILSVTKAVSNIKSTHGDSGRLDNCNAATNSPILLNALTLPLDHGGAASDHTYSCAQPVLRCSIAGVVDHTYAKCGGGDGRSEQKTMTDDDPSAVELEQQCYGCRRKFARRPLMDRHRCRRTVKDEVSLDRFRVDGAQRHYKCDRCPYYTQSQRSAEACFRRHYGMHAAGSDGVKRHRCSQCGKRFAARNTLETHLLMHTGERPYACDECGKRFRHATKAKKHVLFVHRERRNHRCPVCDKPYFTAAQVRVHLKRHTGVRDHVCHVCGKAFLAAKTLAEHAKMVHGDGPGTFACATCGKAYKTKRNMMSHRESAHDRPAAGAVARLAATVT